MRGNTLTEPGASCLQVCRPNNPLVSVLVRVKNEMALLPEFWRRLRGQSFFDNLEVLFLDSGSTDGTLQLLSTLPCSLYQIAPEDFNFGTACNLLMSLSAAPVAVFLSGHVLLTRDDDLQIIHQLLAGQVMTAAYMRQLPNTLSGSSAYERAYLSRRYHVTKDLMPVRLQSPSGFSNAASALTRDAWLCNPFPNTHGSEDFLWAEKHLRSGGKLFYLPGVCALHSHLEQAEAVYHRVRLNVEARGQSRSYFRALKYLVGVFAATVRHGASPAEAWRYASAHARAYLA
jgi:glycosyltransferase involved in cell wall biosynthesis